MKYAKELRDVLKITKPIPLKGDDFAKFFVETDEARGVNAAFLLSDFFQANRDDPQQVLFMGHRGSGKSTELYRFAKYIENEFTVVEFSIKDEADLADLDYADLLFIILNRLYEQAKKDGIRINENVLDNLDHYWRDERLMEHLKIEKASLETEGKIKGGIWSLLSFQIKGILSIGGETREVVRQYIRPRVSKLLNNANDFLSDITDKYNAIGKTPLIVIEDLDKLDLAVAEDLFLKRKNILTEFNAHIVYTFPIFLHYSGKFNEIASAFDHYELLSMVKVRDKRGNPHEAGKRIIRDIVKKRADAALFQPEALEYVIDRSGGSLRHVFEMIQNGVLDARMRDRNAKCLDLASAQNAFRKLRSYFERTIGREHLETLKRVYESSDKKPLPDERLKEMLNCMAVIEYNGDRWCDLHPAVVDMLHEKGEIGHVVT